MHACTSRAHLHNYIQLKLFMHQLMKQYCFLFERNGHRALLKPQLHKPRFDRMIAHRKHLKDHFSGPVRMLFYFKKRSVEGHTLFELGPAAAAAARSRNIRLFELGLWRRPPALPTGSLFDPTLLPQRSQSCPLPRRSREFRW